MKYTVIYQRYDRGCNEPIIKAHFEAENNTQALIKIHNRCLYGCDEETEQSEKELLETLGSMNGDGCDYIFKITNDTTGEILFKESENIYTEIVWED